jgi:DnaJ-class molecular chaperone
MVVDFLIELDEVTCPWCDGVGGHLEAAEEVQSFENCPACHGLGKVLRESVPPPPPDPNLCPRCLGVRGRFVIRETRGWFVPCKSCGGTGRKDA